MSLPDRSRRFFLRGKIAAPPPSAVRPPWAGVESAFLERCARCDDCIGSCPENILIRGDGGYPEVNFKRGECTFCGTCVDRCKTSALSFPMYADEPEKLRRDAWDLEVNFASNCLSLNAVVCRACGDNCEPRAIRFQLKTGGIAEPHLSLADCTGCGACASICPVDAILIKPAAMEDLAA